MYPISSVSDGRVSDGRISDRRISDGRVSDGRVSDGRVSDGRVSDGRVSDGRVSLMCRYTTGCSRTLRCQQSSERGREVKASQLVTSTVDSQRA